MKDVALLYALLLSLFSPATSQAGPRCTLLILRVRTTAAAESTAYNALETAKRACTERGESCWKVKSLDLAWHVALDAAKEARKVAVDNNCLEGME